jgi:hypothetical protein
MNRSWFSWNLGRSARRIFLEWRLLVIVKIGPADCSELSTDIEITSPDDYSELSTAVLEKVRQFSLKTSFKILR